MATFKSADTSGLIATLAIRSAVARHSQGVDRADEALLLDAYHADATVDYGFIKGPANEFAVALCGSQRQSPVTLHRSNTPWIVVDGASAVSETYVTACAEEREENAVQRVICGRYLDRHSCREGEWRLSHRQYVMDMNINRAGASQWPEPAAQLTNAVPRGGHGAMDAGRALLALGHARLTAGGGEKVAAPDQLLLEEALAKLALHDLLMAYARGIDRADRELLDSVFYPDATVISGVFNGAGADFAREITAHITTNLERCFHSIANEWFEVKGDRAMGEAYVIATMTAGGTDTVTGGRYIDEFERRDGVWKIRSHVFVADWNMSMPTSHQTDGMYAVLDSRGCFGRADPVYAHWPAVRHG